VAWDEAVDVDLTRLDGGGGLNPKFLVRDPNNGCKTILPHEYLRVNTIFEVVRASGGARRGPTSTLPMSGPTARRQRRGGFLRTGDQFHPRAAAAIPGCAPVPFADSTPDDGWTNSFDDIKCYDPCAS